MDANTILSLAFLAGWIACFSFAIISISRRRRFSKKSVEVTAKVISTESETVPSEMTDYIVYYSVFEYNLNGKNYKVRKSTNKERPDGAPVTIRCMPDKPEDIILPSEGEAKIVTGWSIFSILFGLILLFMSLILSSV